MQIHRKTNPLHKCFSSANDVSTIFHVFLPRVRDHHHQPDTYQHQQHQLCCSLFSPPPPQRDFFRLLINVEVLIQSVCCEVHFGTLPVVIIYSTLTRCWCCLAERNFPRTLCPWWCCLPDKSWCPGWWLVGDGGGRLWGGPSRSRDFTVQTPEWQTVSDRQPGPHFRSVVPTGRELSRVIFELVWPSPGKRQKLSWFREVGHGYWFSGSVVWIDRLFVV